MSLDPQAKALLDQLGADPDAPRLIDLPPEGGREMYRAMAGMLDLQGVAIGKVEDRTIPGPAGDIPVRLYTPVAAGGTCPALVYYHGGGWVLGELDDYDVLARSLAAATNCALVMPDYRLAPDHRFPAGLDDADDTIQFVANGGLPQLRGLPLVVAGDSAGGNLVTVAAMRLRSKVQIALQVLLYPVTDYNPETASYKANDVRYGLTAADMEWFFAHYAGKQSRTQPEISPLRAEDLSGLPSAVIVTAEYDVLRDEGRAYADALRDAGVPVVYRCVDGMIHGFMRMQNLFDVPRDELQFVAKEIRAACAAQKAAAG